ncbi:MAG: AsmA family protein [Mariprofundaceae bacterium]|nr:AsmA family protein [Mariprofundaceae bacterium]
MVKRTIKYSLAVLALIMVLLLAVPFFIDVNDYKPQITKAVEDATGRTFQVGEIKASLFPWVGVRLDNVRLANRTGFSDRDFLKVESLNVQLDLLPLFSKQIEVKHFTLDTPQLFLERNAEGAGNWEDLTGTAPSSTGTAVTEAGRTGTKPAASPALAAFNAESMQLSHGHLIWMDHATGEQLELSDLQLDINDVQVNRPVEVKASGRVSGEPITVEARVGPLGDISRLDIDRLPIQAELKSSSLGLKPFISWLPEFPGFLGEAADARLRLDLKLEQRPDGMRLSTGEMGLMAKVAVDVKWKAEMASARRIELKNFELSLNSRPLLSAHGEVNLGNKPDYQLRVKSGEPVERAWLASLLPELNEMYAAHPSPWKQLKFGALLAGSGSRVELRDVQVMPDGELIQLSGVASFENDPDIRLRITSRELHIDPWLPQPGAKQEAVKSDVVDGQAGEAVVPQEPDLRGFKGWKISSQFQVEKMHLRGLELDHMRGSLDAGRGLFRLDPLRFDLAGGQVSETATLNVARYPVEWSESVHITGVRIGPVLKALAGTDMLNGTLQMDTNLKATGLLPENSMKRLNGKGSLLLRDGSVKGFDIVGTLQLLRSLGENRGPKKTDFAQLSGSFSVSNGVAKNDDLFMASPLFRLTGNGIVNLPNGTMDYHVKPRLVGTLTGQGDTVTVRKGLSVPIRIKGPFASPKVTPEIDPATLIENIEAIRGGNVLKGLEKVITGKAEEKPQPATPSEPQQQPQKATPEQEIKKRLEGLIRGL